MITRSSVGFALAFALAVLTPARAFADEPSPPKESDTLDPLRERFRAGMERYRARAFADAIVVWTAIYGELGEKGYRLAFYIAEAYEQLGENSTQAAEHYEAYVKATSSRRARGESLDAVAEKQEADAIERLAGLAATKGRIDVKPGGRPVAVRIDDGAARLAGFIAYVTPGKAHVVTFNPGTKDEQKVEVSVGLGEMISLAPPKIAEPVLTVAPTRFETHEERPFDRSVLYVAAGATVLSTLVPILLYVNANDLYDDSESKDASSQRDEKVRLGADYENARFNTYLSYGLPALLGAATLGLVAYWAWGAKVVRVPIQGALVPGGATVGGNIAF